MLLKYAPECWKTCLREFQISNPCSRACCSATHHASYASTIHFSRLLLNFAPPLEGHVAPQHPMLPTQAQFTSAAYSVQIRHLLHFLMTTLFNTTNQCTKCDITKRLCLELSQLEFKNVFNPDCQIFTKKCCF